MVTTLVNAHGALAGFLIALVFLFVLSVLLFHQGHKLQQVTMALTYMQQQQTLLHDQQQRFEPVLEHQVKPLQGQFQTGLLHTQQEVTNLSKALRTTHQQGSWGELQLLTCLTLADMQEHYDFEAQKSFPSLDRRQHPDVVI